MKATGVIRRIDELGRIVIPKEIRKNLKIKEGTGLEIFIDENGRLVLQKIDDLIGLPFDVNAICQTLSENLLLPVFISTNEKIISSNKNQKISNDNLKLIPPIIKILENRKLEIVPVELINIYFNNLKIEANKYKELFVFPIIIDSSVLGGIFVLNTDSTKEPEIKSALEIILSLLSK